jgi:hypothetical protein
MKEPGTKYSLNVLLRVVVHNPHWGKMEKIHRKGAEDAKKKSISASRKKNLLRSHDSLRRGGVYPRPV